MQHGMQRRVGACVQGVALEAGLGLTPVAAGNVFAGRNQSQLQVEARQQHAHCDTIQSGQAQHERNPPPGYSDDRRRVTTLAMSRASASMRISFSRSLASSLVSSKL